MSDLRRFAFDAARASSAVLVLSILSACGGGGGGGSAAPGATFAPAMVGGGELELLALDLGGDGSSAFVATGLAGFAPVGAAYDGSTDTLYVLDEDARLHSLDPLTGAPRSTTQLPVTTFESLAVDPVTRRLYTVGPAKLWVLDAASGDTIDILPTGADQVRALAFRTNTSTLYGIEYATGRLLSFDLATGQENEVHGPDVFMQTTVGLTHDAIGDRLIASREDGTLYEIEFAGGLAIQGIGTTPHGGYDGAAYDGVRGRLLGTSRQRLRLDEVDPVTAGADTIGVLGTRTTETLAVDPDTGAAFTYDYSTGELLLLDGDLRGATVVGEVTSSAPPFLTGLTFATGPKELLGSDGTSLWSIDPATGAGQVVGTVPQAVQCIEYDRVSGVLYGWSAATGALHTLDRATGASTSEVPTTGLFAVVGMARVPSSDLLLVMDNFSNSLNTLDPVTGDVEFLRAFGSNTVIPLDFDLASDGSGLVMMEGTGHGVLRHSSWNGIVTTGAKVGGFDPGFESYARDPATGTYYAAGSTFSDLFSIDPVAGTANLVGTITLQPGGFPLSPTGLAFDPGTGTLFALEDDGDRLVRIDPSTAVATEIGALGVDGAQGLAYDAESEILYAWAGPAPGALHRVDTATGAATFFGTGFPGVFGVSGMCFDPVSRVLFGVDRPTDRLLVIDPSNGSTMAVDGLPTGSDVRGCEIDADARRIEFVSGDGNLLSIDVDGLDPRNLGLVVLGDPGFGDYAGVAFDPTTGIGYAGSALRGRFVAFDSSRGEVRILGDDFDSDLFALDGLSVDTSNGRLVGCVAAAPGRLVEVSPITGRSSHLAPLARRLSALAYDESTGDYFGADPAANELVRVDAGTGAIATIGTFAAIFPSPLVSSQPTVAQAPSEFDDVTGLAFDHTTGVLHGVDAGLRAFISIDPTTGTGTYLGETTHPVLGLGGRVP
ncbi:MAG: hypothetical protein R3F34_09905 [Planctomycetota bacterium]